MPFNEIDGKDDLERAEKLVQKCIEVRGVKIKITEVPIPVPYGSAFEGERVRKDDMRVEFGGKRSHAFEFLRMRRLDEVEDGKIDVVGPDLDEIEGGRAHGPRHRRGRGGPQDADGLRAGPRAPVPPLHQRRRGRAAHRPARHRLDPHQQGRRGQGLQPRALRRDPARPLPRRCSAPSSTRCRSPSTPSRTRSTRCSQVAREAYDERNERMADLTDDTVDDVLLAARCARASRPTTSASSRPSAWVCAARTTGSTARRRYEINPTGPNQPIPKGLVIDPVKGEFSGPNEYIYQNSNQFGGAGVTSTPSWQRF